MRKAGEGGKDGRRIGTRCAHGPVTANAQEAFGFPSNKASPERGFTASLPPDSGLDNARAGPGPAAGDARSARPFFVPNHSERHAETH